MDDRNGVYSCTPARQCQLFCFSNTRLGQKALTAYCVSMLQTVGDPFIWVPNGIGGIMSVFLISLTLVYPAAVSSTSTAGLAAPLNAS